MANEVLQSHSQEETHEHIDVVPAPPEQTVCPEPMEPEDRRESGEEPMETIEQRLDNLEDQIEQLEQGGEDHRDGQLDVG